MNVEAWLAEIGFEQYAAAFVENGVESSLLPKLTNEDLKDLGVTRLAEGRPRRAAVPRAGSG